MLKHKDYIQSALSELQRLIDSAGTQLGRVCQSHSDAAVKQTRIQLHATSKKLDFFLAWVSDSQSSNMIADTVSQVESFIKMHR